MASPGKSAAAAVAEYRKGAANNLDLAGKFARDPEVHPELRMLHAYSAPYHDVYTNLIETTRTGLGTAEAAAGRACGDWMEDVCKVVKLVTDEKTLTYCKIDTMVNVRNWHSWAGCEDQDKREYKPD